MLRREARANDVVRLLSILVLLAYIASEQGWLMTHEPALSAEQRFIRFVDQVIWQRPE